MECIVCYLSKEMYIYSQLKKKKTVNNSTKEKQKN